jgi:hypothetical protein
MRKVTTPVPVEGGVMGGTLPMSAGTSPHGRRKPNGSACQRRTMAEVQDEAKHAMSAMSPLKSWSCDTAPWLVARPAQSAFQLLLLLCPARVLRLRPSVECSAVSFDFFDLGFMLTLRFFKRCFGLCDRLLAPLAFLLPRGLFLPALAIAPLPFSLERKSGLARCFVVDLLSRRFFCGRSRLCCPLLVDG